MTYDPKDAVIHVVHDYVYLVAAGTDTQRPLHHPFNHYAERTFHVHCRSFASFFSGADKRATFLLRTSLGSHSGQALPVWDDWHDHLDKHLMHLTQGRITNSVPWTGAPNRGLLEEFRAAWKGFLVQVKDDLRPLFDKAIEGHQQQFIGYSFK